MELSVVILNYNVSAFLQLCLHSVTDALKTIDSEIIVVDNNSADDSVNMVRTHFPDAKIIVNPDNYGFSKGNNIGVKTAKGYYICILNPDTVVSETTFKNILEFAKSRKNLGAIGCRLIDGRGHFLPESKRRIPTPKVSLKKLLGYPKDYYQTNIDDNKVGECDILVGAFMFMERNIYEVIGGFDEDYFMYGEDIDLSYKLLKRDLRNYYFGKEIVIHFKGESTLKDVNYAKRFYGAMEIFYQKHFKKNTMFNGMVNLGIQLAFALRRATIPKAEVSNHTYYLGANCSAELKEILTEPVMESTLSDNIPANSLVVFDSETYSYGEIIKFMLKHAKTDNVKYRIQVKNTNFILGSDSSLCQGDIHYF